MTLPGRPTLVGRLVAAAACALVAHAVLYRTFAPVDGAHGYFGWYEPLVATGSVLSLCAILALVAAAASGRGPALALVRRAPRPFENVFGELFGTTLLVLVIQESVERTVSTGTPALAAFTPSGWLALAVVTAIPTLCLAIAFHLGRAAVQRYVRESCPHVARGAEVPQWFAASIAPRRSRPLAERFGLRAPPLLGT